VTVDDEQLTDLRRQFPAWQIWYVPSSGRGGTWCANPWAKEKDRTGVLHADKPEHLAEYMREFEAEHAGQLVTGTAQPEGS
jgi:hypothetical protein